MTLKRSVSFADDTAAYIKDLDNASAYINALIRRDMIRREIAAAAASRTTDDEQFTTDAAVAAADMWAAE
ncbi:hypothetical protein [Nocardia sp. IFM 10818]